ncbi:erythromycin esterase family protein [Phenylobacterium sp.]|uniref:erythromycin esterase family protein n=1 Tax=Phenylobacterium sp. TaxID=1871053 RepID=UPI0025EC0882|nr:erythromycin esterase family protein [Phenylobacterium sp.]MBX3485246.1 erythromycin esterase family protein [Phenylobacterium sp.]
MPDIRPPVEGAWVERDRLLPRGAAGAIAAAAEPLPPVDDPEFGKLFDRFGDAKVVLLGAASHGTREFHQARAAITRWLIEHRGFRIVALEADWPDAQALDARVRGKGRPPGRAFAPFPRWMWRNREFEGFLQWLAAHNASHGRGSQARIAGLDLYNLAGSMRATVDHLERVDPEAAKVARERYGCLTPWAQEPAAYGRMAVSGRYAACEGAVTAMLREMLDRQFRERGRADEDLLDAAQGARLAKDAEAYYRAMYYGGAEAWNLRDTHMFDTLKALLDANRDARAVVWAHNSHIGDARATEMGAVRDEVSLGQLCREAWGDNARLIGFGTHAGTVACAGDWDGPMEVQELKPSMPESHERQSHNAGIDRFLLDMRPEARNGVRRALADPHLERFIGAVYRPETERWSHYADCRLAEQYDAWVWFDETTAATPLGDERTGGPVSGAEDTWPFGA